MTKNWIEDWEAQPEEINDIFSRNPSLRGMFHGYLAEEKLKTMFWEGSENITNLTSPDDHDRDLKGDWLFDYKGEEIIVEVKSLQTNYIEQVETLDGPQWTGKYQCDASDKREITLPTGKSIETTLLQEGEFDLLAVNLFGFGEEWRFAFAKNEDLTKTTHGAYEEDVQQYLIKGMHNISYPLDKPYREEPWELLDETLEAREEGDQPR